MKLFLLETYCLKFSALLFLLFFAPVLLEGQDSLLRNPTPPDSVLKDRSSALKSTVLQKVLEQNFLLHHQNTGAPLQQHVNRRPGPEGIFYLLLVLTALFAFLRFFYERYFHTLFRVFFNTTLRQSQLTDQLMQSKLASLFFNILFCLSGGLFLFFLLTGSGRAASLNPALLLAACLAGIASVYAVKYLVLKFTGWLTGLKTTTDTYIFIIFLVNKILGILLLPFLILTAFTDEPLKEYARYAALFIIGLLLITRFVRAFGLLQNKIRVSRFHFLLYVAGIEVIPLLVLCKVLFSILDKNL
jgi:hypothetical protein